MEHVIEGKRYTKEGVHTFLDVDGFYLMVYEEGTLPYNTGVFNRDVALFTQQTGMEVHRLKIQKGRMKEFLTNISKEPLLVKEVIL